MKNIIFESLAAEYGMIITMARTDLTVRKWCAQNVWHSLIKAVQDF